MKVKNLAFFGIMASILGVSAANAAGDGTALTTKAYVDKYDAATLDSAKDYTNTQLADYTKTNDLPTYTAYVEDEINSASTTKAPSGHAVSSAISGINSALAGKQATIDSTHKLDAGLVSGLATVATTGSYNNLTDTPTAADYVANAINSSDENKAPSGKAVSSAITSINSALDGKQATINAQNTLSGAYLTDSTVSSAKLDAALSSTINSKLDANSALNGAKLTDGTVSSDKLDTALSSTISGKLNANAAIQSGTHTKITYDANGLVTSGTSLATSDLPVPANNIDGVAQQCPTGTRCVLTFTNDTWSLTPMNTIADETTTPATGA